MKSVKNLIDTQVGNHLWRYICNQIDWGVHVQSCNQIKDKVQDQVGEQVRDQIEYQMSANLANKEEST